MAVVFDAVGPSSAGTATAITTAISWSHTCTGSNLLLVVGLSVGRGTSSTTTTATYNSVSMSSAGRVFANNQNDGYIELFYLVTPATGSNTVAISCNQAVDLIGGSVSFTGVDQATPVSTAATAFGSSAAPSVNVSSASGNMVVDVVGAGNVVSSSGQTNRWLNNFNNNSGAGNSAQSTASGAGTVTMSYTLGAGDWWGIIGMNINAASVAVTPAVIAWVKA